MNDIINFLKNRRSVTAKKMKDGHVSDEHLKEIIECGHRQKPQQAQEQKLEELNSSIGA